MSDQIRIFRRAAGQRKAAAEFLFTGRLYLDAYDLAGYAIECALKALILAKTPMGRRTERVEEIGRGKEMHNYQKLAEILKSSGSPIPLPLMKRLRRSRWSTDLRYLSGLWDYDDSRYFLQTVDEVLRWVDGGLS